MENLERKLSLFAESATGPDDPRVTPSYKQICALEAEYVLPTCDRSQDLTGCYRDLKKESYGVELLQVIGFVYIAKAKHFLASSQTLFGIGGWVHNVQGKYHVFSET